MTTPSELIRDNFPEFNKVLNDFKERYGAIKLEHVKTPVGEWGKPLTGVEVDPVISDKVKNDK